MVNTQNKNIHIKNLTLSAMFLAVGLVLPFVTGQVPQIGNMLLPMHIPVLLCGFICGWQYGLVVGFILPLLRHVMFGMPILFPMGISMAFELATYGFVTGWLYGHSKWKCVRALYRALIIAMLAGRSVWGVARVVLMGFSGQPFTFPMFIAGGFVTAIPGIILQLILIPAIMMALKRIGMVPLHKNTKDTAKAVVEEK